MAKTRNVIETVYFEVDRNVFNSENEFEQVYLIQSSYLGCVVFNEVGAAGRAILRYQDSCFLLQYNVPKHLQHKMYEMHQETKGIMHQTEACFCPVQEPLLRSDTLNIEYYAGYWKFERIAMEGILRIRMEFIECNILEKRKFIDAKNLSYEKNIDAMSNEIEIKDNRLKVSINALELSLVLSIGVIATAPVTTSLMLSPLMAGGLFYVSREIYRLFNEVDQTKKSKAEAEMQHKLFYHRDSKAVLEQAASLKLSFGSSP